LARIEQALKAGQIVIDMSTVSPHAERAIATRNYCEAVRFRM
jgi:3-hydroxyisobutyrate dehydrogenase-like beta-hydroxyacid dehydrogenase